MIANSRTNPLSNQFDVIVIGSGMGGMATASLLAQIAGKRVLLLESHFKLGGFTHSFRRGRYEWEAGLHYVGEMQSGAMTRRIMDLVTDGGVEWFNMGSPFERYVFPEMTFEVPEEQGEFRRKLIDAFPAEADAIRRYFRDMKRSQKWIARWFVGKQLPPALASLLVWPGSKLARTTTADYMEQNFQSPVLKAILTAQWPDYGTPPAQSAFGLHATVAADFLHGGYYPVGGGSEIARHVQAVVESRGGQCLVNHPVRKLIVQRGRAGGVQVEHKGRTIEFFAPQIVSNAGAAITFGKLLDHADGGAPEREQLQRVVRGPSANILFLGLNDDPRKHGFDLANYWIYERTDHDDQRNIREGNPERVDGAFLSFGSLRNPGQEPHTAQIVSFSRMQYWEKFTPSSWKKRGEEYEQKKEAIADHLLDFICSRYPQLRSLISLRELSSPLTVETFTGHPGGTVYGQACDANRLFRDRWSIGTSVPGLYLTGSDVGTPGVNGALMAGVMTAAKLIGFSGLPRIFTAAFRR